MGLSNDIAALKTQIGQLRVKYQQRKSVVAQALPPNVSQELDALRRQNDTLQKQLVSISASFQKENTNLKTQLTQTQRNYEAYILKAHAVQGNLEKKFNQELETARRGGSSECDQLRAQVKELRTENDQLQKSLKAELDRVNREKDSQGRSAQQTLESECSKIEKRHQAEIRKLNDQILALTKENAHLQSVERTGQKQSQQEILKAQRACEDKVKLLEQEKVNYRLEINSYKRKIEKLKNDFVQIRRRFDDYDRITRDREKNNLAYRRLQVNIYADYFRNV
jgi:chromosome segregation ATPase